MIKTLRMTSAALLLYAAAASAHHGTSAHFDHDKNITVEGVVSEMKFVNPHSYLFFDVLSENGQTVPWRCEMVEAGTLRRAGLTAEILAPGTVVRVNGQPARREDAVCYLESMTLTDGTTISHRGRIEQGGAGFTPNAALQAITVSSAIDDNVTLATGGHEAAARKIVDVPTQGMFGHWAEGGRRALIANTDAAQANGGGGMGTGMGGGNAGGGNAGGGMGTGMGTGMGGGNAGGGMGTGRGTGMGGGNAGGGMGAAAGGSETTDGSVSTSDAGPQYNEIGLEYAQRYDPNYDNPALACSASLLFGISHHSLANEFVQLSDKEVRWTYGYMDMVRTIHIDGEFPAQITPSTSGYSIGKWEGDTLVVTTKAIAPGVLFAKAADRGGALSTINSDQLVVTEHITHNKQTDKLMIKWSAADTGYWTNTMAGELELTRSTPYEIYGCEELAGQNNVRPNGAGLFDIETVSGKSNIPSSAATPSSSDSSSGKLAMIIALLAALAALGAVLYKRFASKDA